MLGVGTILSMVLGVFGINTATKTGMRALAFIKYGIYAIIIASAAWFIYSKYNEWVETKEAVKNLQIENGKKEREILELRNNLKAQEEEIALLKKSNEIDNQISSDLAKEREELKDKQKTIEENRVKREAAVKSNPVRKITTVDPSTKKETIEIIELTPSQVEQEISQIRIDSIWEAYCNSNKPSSLSQTECSKILSSTPQQG
jgi:hypothetical protein